MVKEYIALLRGLPQSNARNDDDIADRLSHRYTVSAFIIFSSILAASQFTGERIQCWHPQHFSGAWESYTNSYCWIKDTYYLPMEDDIPKPHEADRRNRLTYYQWVPLIILAQAFLFYFPIIFWRTLNVRSGLDVNNIIETAESFNETGKVADRKKHLTFMSLHMHRYLTSGRMQGKKDCVVGITSLLSSICFKCSRAGGTFLIPLYLFTKLLFLTNVIGQIFMLNHLLGTDYHMYGIDWLSSKFSGESFGPSSAFPRVTMCDIFVRRLGNVQRYTMQCVLPINLFNEMVFLIIWFWMVIIAIITAASLLSWTVRSITRIDRHRYVRKHLGLIKHMNRLRGQKSIHDADTVPDTPESEDSVTLQKKRAQHIEVPEPFNWDREMFVKFVDQYLKADGVFIMRLIQHNTNSLTVDEFLATMWDHFQKDEAANKPIFRPTM